MNERVRIDHLEGSWTENERRRVGQEGEVVGAACDGRYDVAVQFRDGTWCYFAPEELVWLP